MLIFAYGTLKKGHYNHTRFGNPLGFPIDMEDRVHDFTLIQTNSYYPTAVPMENKFIEGEVWYVPDTHTVYCLLDMELGAGYQAKHVLTEKGRKALLFFNPDYDEEKIKSLKLTPFSKFDLKVLSTES